MKSIEDAINIAKKLNISALLFNCSQPEEIEPALKILKLQAFNIPYGAYANAFEPIKKDQKANSDETIVREDTTPENYLNFAQKWKDLGASIIGGCCGIGPDHIAKLTELNT